MSRNNSSILNLATLVTYFLICFDRECSEEVEQEFAWAPTTVMVQFMLPEGWNVVNGMAYCPKHSVTIG